MANDPLAQLREQTIASKRESLETEVNTLLADLEQSRELARDYLRNGDVESAKFEDEYIISKESDLQTLALELERYGGGRAQEAQLTPAEQQYLAQCGDSVLRPHWSGLRNPDGSPVIGLQALGFAHDYARAHNIPRDSKTAFEILEVVSPVEKSPVPTPREVCEMTGIDGKTYNRGVRELHKRKAQGDYRDR